MHRYHVTHHGSIRNHTLALATLAVCVGYVRAGNVVPNSGFELNTGCPSSFSQLNLATSWSAPTAGTSDYFNACDSGTVASVPTNFAGSQAAFAGDAYAGIIVYDANPMVDWREYIEAPLTAPLVAGRTYDVGFFVSLAEGSEWAIDSIGAYFQFGSVGPLATWTPLAFTPQVVSTPSVLLTNSAGWTLISGSFVAAGGEDHIVIGNFVATSSTNAAYQGAGIGYGYYYIDGVFAQEHISPAYCTPGTTSNGCVPAISCVGIASASAGSGFTISVANVEGQKQGLLFYGVSGQIAVPWSSGSTSFMCVKAPTQRIGVQNSGGTSGACDGQLLVDWNAYIASHPSALGNPFSAGDIVDAQAWFRDPPAPKTTNLSNALEFTVQP